MRAQLYRGPGRVFAVTGDETGTNLPAKYAPWTFLKSIEIERGTPTPGLDIDECLADMETLGVHITDAHVRLTDEAIR